MKSWIALLLILSGCGSMKVTTRKYFSISNGEDVNYYRLRIKGRSVLGNAQFRAGWYPTESVDMLFGDVSEDAETDYQKTKQEIKKHLNKTIKETYQAYLDTAKHPDTNAKYLEKVLEARRRVLLAPEKYSSLDRSYIVEYDVTKGVAISHSDEKLIYILSSDPDEVIGKIANFTESEKTVKTIQNLSRTLGNQKLMELENEKAQVARLDTLIKSQVTKVITALENDADEEKQLAILINLLKE
ncbi:MAG: hypothetical protein ABJP45_06525 [Cyclobacteriaceae bacterium]